jgi:plastocyanin
MIVLGRSGIGVLALVAAVGAAPARAQHMGHESPDRPALAGADAALSACRQQAPRALATIDRLAARLEVARQVNSGPDMRAAMDALQGALGELREFASACAGGEQSGSHAGHAMTSGGAPPASAAGTASAEMHAAHQAAQGAAPGSDLKIAVTDAGFEPAGVTVKKGEAVRLTFVRTSQKTCGEEVVFPELGVRKALPLDEPVTIEFTPARSGEIAFTCGMNMLEGAVVVR